MNNEESMWIIGGMFVVIVGLLGFGYSQKLSDTGMQKLENTISIYDDLPAKIEKAKNTLKGSKMYDEMKTLYKSQNMDGIYKDAHQSWVAYKKDIDRMRQIQKDDPWWVVDEATALMKKIDTAVASINTNLRKPETTLTKIKNEIDILIAENSIDSEYATLLKSYDSLQKQAAAQKGKFKDKASKIDIMMKPYVSTFKIIETHRNTTNKNLDMVYNMNYSEFVTSKDAFYKFAKSTSSQMNNNMNSLSSLDKSYSKVLSDMKAEYKVSFGMAHWDNYSDWDTTKTEVTSYKVVSEDAFYKIGDSTFDLVASCKKGGLFSDGGCNIYVPEIKPYLNTGSIPRGQTHIEYWVQDMKPKFWHKYTVESDGKTTETDWVVVSESVYWDNYKNLGMAMETKPIGSFTDETINEATPPGMAYVGNPNYGNYNSSGNWIFLPMWFNSYGSYGYDRNDYNDYNRHRTSRIATSGYYGRNNGFGTSGKRTFSKGSTFVRSSNPTRQATLSRSSKSGGSNSRGRGAGGGGK